MQLSFTDRLKHAWNVFKNRDPTDYWSKDSGYWSVSPFRPYYNKPYYGVSDHSIVTAIKNRIAVDAASVDIQHVKVDDNGRYVKTIDSGLNRCLNLSANIDQTGRAFRLDVFLSLLDEGVIALLPIDVDVDPNATGSYDIETMRVGKIVDWRPKEVRINCYNENTGQREDVVVPKKIVAIVENPFYAVMNEPNSTFQRLIHKLALLDSVDEQASSGKLDLILQLPYVIKGETRMQQAERRRQEIERQLKDSKYGIAYTDGTEKIQQLNRPLENNLLSQIQYLTDVAYSQLGMTPEILNGTADEKTMLNYNNRIIEPLVAAVADSMKRTFLTKTAITQKQSIEYYKDPFALVPIDNIAEIADKFTRNEIVTSNEIRQIIGMKPSDDPNADVLRNKNLYDTSSGMGGPGALPTSAAEDPNANEPATEEDMEQALDDLDDLDAQLDDLEDSLDEEIAHSYTPEQRHEYYEKYEKYGRKKGYATGSTSGLNEEGREYAKYVREQLMAERKAKVDAHKSYVDQSIEKSRESTSAGVEASKNRRDENISRINEGRDAKIENQRNATNSEIESSKNRRDETISKINSERDSRLESERNATNSEIESSAKARDARVASTNAQRDRDLENERTRTKSEIESHKNTMQMKIDTLKSMLKGLSKEDREAVKERISLEIADLREENSKKRAELQEALKTTTTDIRTKAKSETDSAKEEHRSNSTTARAKLKETSADIRTEAKAGADSAREEHSTNTSSARVKLKETSEGIRAEAKAGADEERQSHTDTANALREGHKGTTKALREEHKGVTAQAKQDYEDQYAKELEYIKSLPQYKKATKKASGSSNKTTRTNYHEVKG